MYTHPKPKVPPPTPPPAYKQLKLKNLDMYMYMCVPVCLFVYMCDDILLLFKTSISTKVPFENEIFQYWHFTLWYVENVVQHKHKQSSEIYSLDFSLTVPMLSNRGYIRYEKIHDLFQFHVLSMQCDLSYVPPTDILIIYVLILCSIHLQLR